MYSPKQYMLLLLSSIFIAGCSSKPSQPFHTILGADNWGYPGDVTTITSDIHVDGLHVRVVKTENSQCVNGFSSHIELSGPIGPDSAFVVDKLLDELEHCVDKDTGTTYSRNIFLNSPGGYLLYGFNMGVVFRDQQMTTIVSKGQQCASSCAIAFLGGKFRNMHNEGELLFHAPYYRKNSREMICQSREESSTLRNYYDSMLDSEDSRRLFDRTMSQCSTTEGWTVNSDAAGLYGITGSSNSINIFNDSNSAALLAFELSDLGSNQQEHLRIAKKLFSHIPAESNMYSEAKVMEVLIDYELKQNLDDIGQRATQAGTSLINKNDLSELADDDIDMALELFTIAIETNYLPAYVRLGYAYKLIPAIQDTQQAKVWFEKAVSEGNYDIARVELGIIERGNERYKEALDWFDAASISELPNVAGYAFAMIGHMFEIGDGVPKSLDKAIENYTQAAKLGHKWSVERLIHHYQSINNATEQAYWQDVLKALS
ncbi:hypothetical protein [Vibrio agarivorans]|uniref:Sel1 repeat family protein n=1 Tax=Vibrio agarivorans TaxID=153622 RepID=A0ABT7XXI1_9VIBR|nr:hypothetical protein [Vibrio agarivorans]MDN2480487.1 hypothetical protein [Vibrio agarivorans]